MAAINSCFFCLKSTKSKSKSDRDNLSLKWLYRHLMINSESEVKYFCKECLEIVKKFNELYGQFEAIQVQLDYCLKRIQKKIGKKKDDSTSDGKMRGRIGAKCEKAISELMPVVKIRRLECPSLIVKEEVLSPDSNDGLWSREVPLLEHNGEIVGAIAVLGENSSRLALSDDGDADNEAMDKEGIKSQTEGYTSVSINHKTDESILLANYDKETKSCVKCQKSFTRFGHFTRHFEHVHLKLIFTCDTCKAEYTTRVVLRKHLRTKHPTKNEEEVEGQQLEPGRILDSNRISLDYRISDSQLRENYINKRCRLCDQFCQRPALFERHFISAHLKLRFTCDICEAEFSRRDYLKAHLERHKQEGNEKENCSRGWNQPSPAGQASVGNFDLWLPPGQLLEGLENYVGEADGVPDLNQIPGWSSGGRRGISR